MELRLKPGVQINGLKHPMLWPITVAMQLYKLQGASELVITSAIRAPTSTYSLHPAGFAVDLRIWGLEDPRYIVREMNQTMGPHYQAILEPDHIHIEYDPPRKRPRA